MSLTILALDTSTEACSVALLRNNQILSQFIVSERDHTQRILPMVDQILSEADCQLSSLDAIAFGRGPGSFTGVRIGIGIAQGLALGADKPLLAVSTLATLAQGAYRTVKAENVITAIDARMNEIYFGQYQRNTDGEWIVLGSEKVIHPEQVITTLQPFKQPKSVYAVGTGWQTYPNMIANPQFIELNLPHAEDMLPIAQKMWEKGLLTLVADVEPIYLRNEVTWKKLPGR